MCNVCCVCCVMLCFWLLFLLEAIGSNTCSLLNCKDYWKRPNNDVSAALSLRTSLANFILNDNFLVGKISYKLFHQSRANMVNFILIQLVAWLIFPRFARVTCFFVSRSDWSIVLF